MGGEAVDFVLPGERSEYTATLVVPERATGLQLSEGSWDFSSPAGSHTLTWDNPVSQADSLVVGVVGQGPHSWNVYGYTKTLPADATGLTRPNVGLPSGFSFAYRVEAGVFQADFG